VETNAVDHRRLADSRLFRGLDENELGLLLEISDQEAFAEGERIFSDGDLGSKLYIVIAGDVRVSLAVAGGGEEALAILGAGESFGQMSLMSEKKLPRSASSIAHTDCGVLSFDRQALLALLESDHHIGYVVLRNLLMEVSSHLRATNDKLMFLSQTGQF
jgi:CRP/FNR family cyclic AMP-dependent transcriptional regulator